LSACGGGGSSSAPIQPPPPVDTVPPAITLIGDNPQIIDAGSAYTELGAIATDNVDGDVSGAIVIDASAVDSSTAGSYQVTYDVRDGAGNSATTVVRAVTVVAPPPSSDATLSSLTLSAGTLVPAFDPSINEYELTVPFGAHRLTIVPLPNDPNASQRINGGASSTLNLAEGVNSVNILVTAEDGTTTTNYEIKATRLALAQQAYIKAVNPSVSDNFGTQAVLSGDGNTLIISSRFEDGAGVGVNSNPGNDDAEGSGAVYAYTRDAVGDWDSNSYIKASNTDSGDGFGESAAISRDGSTLAVGAPWEDSAATGVNGDQGNEFEFFDAGAVYVFARDTGGTWTQQAYVKPSVINMDGAGGSSNEWFGRTVALSADGNKMAVGAISRSGPIASGSVFIFDRGSGGAWTETAIVSVPSFFFGSSLALSAGGDTLAVGDFSDSSESTGINGAPAGNGLIDAGAAHVFARNPDNTWAQEAYFKASSPSDCEYFGDSVALSDDGNMLAVGGPSEDNAGAIVICEEFDNRWNTTSGSVSLYARDTGGNWSLHEYLKASNAHNGDFFGQAVSFSGDGSSLIVGASDDSAATGVNGDQSDETARGAGAAYLLMRDAGGGWRQQAYIKASNTEQGDGFGASVSLSGNGLTIVVGAPPEDSNATAVNGDQSDNSTFSSGAAYVFQ
jgi:hypothetical protein